MVLLKEYYNIYLKFFMCNKLCFIIISRSLKFNIKEVFVKINKEGI